MNGASDYWPALPFAEWKDTAITLHMWTQIVGKIRLALNPVDQPFLARHSLCHFSRPDDFADPARFFYV